MVHSGLNYAQAFDALYYQPNYDHWRRHMPVPAALPGFARWLTHSRLVDFFLVPLLVGLHPEAPSFNRAYGDRPEISWFDEERPDRGDPSNVSASKIAFVHNIDPLVKQIQDDGARVALMPVVWRPEVVESVETWKKIEERSHNSVRYTLAFAELLKEIAHQGGAEFIPFPADEMTSQNWVDSMHLDTDGASKKALHVASALRRAIEAETPAP